MEHPTTAPAVMPPPPLRPPAGVQLGDELPAHVVYAGFWRRFWAFVLDIVFVFLLTCLLRLALPDGVAELVASLLVVAAYVVSTTMLGGSVGKRMLGLRVVNARDGQFVSLGRACLRELLMRPISIAAIGAGALWMLEQPQRQGWHDMAADTVVVRELPMLLSPPWAGLPHP